MSKGWDEAVDGVLKEFIPLVVKSPVALATLVLSTFFGYGISFIIFDYRSSSVGKSHYLFHLALGLGYAATIFAVVNFDLLSHNLTVDQISARMPLTLLVSFIIAFFMMTAGAIWRQFFYSPKEGK
jgi:hypothetical protein